MTTAETLAEFVCNLSAKDIPEAAMTGAKRCLLDVAGAAASGADSLLARALRRFAIEQFAAGSSDVWFSEARLTAPGAALANAAAASALDIDDGHRAAGGHPGASVIPAAIAVAQSAGADGRDLLTAIVIGYEVAVRVAAARDFNRLDTMSTGRWCAYGAAAAGGWLAGMAPWTLAESLAVAGVQSPGLSASGYSQRMGNHVKEGIPWATFTGLSAMELALNGFCGPVDLLDFPDYYDAAKITSGLGERFAIETVYFKPYACCRWIHSAIDALCEMMAANRVAAEDISAVSVHTFQRALRLNNYPDPESIEGAQYSVAFCLAVAAVAGKGALLPLSPDLLHRSDIVDMARRISISLDDKLDRLFPVSTAARVRITARGTVFEQTVIDPLGDPVNPMSQDQLVHKFHTLTAPRISREFREAFLQAVSNLDHGGCRKLFDMLRIYNPGGCLRP
jgi:2-methylcitrate dehydratase PrpD